MKFKCLYMWTHTNSWAKLKSKMAKWQVWGVCPIVERLEGAKEGVQGPDKTWIVGRWGLWRRIQLLPLWATQRQNSAWDLEECTKKQLHCKACEVWGAEDWAYDVHLTVSCWRLSLVQLHYKVDPEEPMALCTWTSLRSVTSGTK